MVRDEELLFKVDDPKDVAQKFARDFYNQDNWLGCRIEDIQDCLDKSNPRYHQAWVQVWACAFKIVEEEGIEFEYKLLRRGGKLYMTLGLER